MNRIINSSTPLAKVNLYAVEILSGKTEPLNDYVRVLQSFPQEALDGLAVILQAALRYGINVDKQLDCMKNELSHFDLSQTNEIVQLKYQRLCDLMNLYVASESSSLLFSLIISKTHNILI